MPLTVDDISKAILLLFRLGVCARFIYCMIRIGATEEESGQYKKRAKNVILFYIMAECIWQIKEILIWYYG